MPSLECLVFLRFNSVPCCSLCFLSYCLIEMVQTLVGNTTSLFHTAQKLPEWSVAFKKGLRHVWFSQDFQKQWWEKRLNVCVICETYKTNWHIESHRMKEDYGTAFDGPLTSFGLAFVFESFLFERQSRLQQKGTRMFPCIFVGYALNFGGDLIIKDRHDTIKNVF